ncbi:MAG: hypothetical protein AAF539_11915, partial [Planctomycetota bacterium]
MGSRLFCWQGIVARIAPVVGKSFLSIGSRWVAAAMCGILFLPSASAQLTQPQTNLSPIGPPSFTPPPLSPSAVPTFDPYSPSAAASPLGLPSTSGSVGSSIFAGPPIGNPNYPNGGLLNGLFSGRLFQGNTSTAGYTNNLGLAPGAAPYAAPPIYNYGGSPGLGPTTGSASFPSSAYPSSAPSTLFPGGVFGPAGFSGSTGFGSAPLSAPTFGNGTLFPNGVIETFSAYRFLHGPRLRHTFISGGDGVTDVGLNQTDVSIGF